MHHWKLYNASLTITPRDFNATMELKAKITNTEKLETQSFEKDLWTKAIPQVGFSIRGIAKIGLTVTYQIALSTKLAASAEFTFGATSEIPNDTPLVIDIVDIDRSGYDGPRTPLAFPVFNLNSLTGSAKFGAASQAILAFGMEITEVENVAIEFNLKIPQFSVTLNAGYGRLRPG